MVGRHGNKDRYDDNVFRVYFFSNVIVNTRSYVIANVTFCRSLVPLSFGGTRRGGHRVQRICIYTRLEDFWELLILISISPKNTIRGGSEASCREGGGRE